MEIIKAHKNLNSVTQEMDKLISENQNNEKYLNNILKEINRFYKKLQLLDPSMLPSHNHILQMNALKDNLLKKRNIALRKQLNFDK